MRIMKCRDSFSNLLEAKTKIEPIKDSISRVEIFEL